MATVTVVITDVAESRAKVACDFIDRELGPLTGGTCVAVISSDDASYHEIADSLIDAVEIAKKHQNT